MRRAYGQSGTDPIRDFRLERRGYLEQVSNALATFVWRNYDTISKALSHLPSIYPEDNDLQKVKNGGKLSFNKYSKANTIGGLAKAVEKGTDETIAILSLKDNGSYQYWQPIKVFRYN